MGAALLANLWTWWITRNLEGNVTRGRRLRKKAEKEKRVYADDDC